MSGDRDADHIDPASVAQDRALLDEQDQVLRHVERTVAHRTSATVDAYIPTIGELHGAIDKVRDVFSRYYVLLTHKAIISFEPTPQYDVYKAFSFAWIQDSEHLDYKRCE